MKNFVIIFFISISSIVFSQKDSTTIQFKYIENDELELMNELNGIQMSTLMCTDTQMLGKHFKISIKEFENGIIKDDDCFSITCKEQRIPMIVGSDTMIYVMNDCDYVTYNETETPFKIMFAGKLQEDSLKLLVQYPGVRYKIKLRGKEDYSLREIILEEDERVKIALRKEVPIMAYTPPFNAGQMNSYCLLDDISPKLWYEKYKIPHFHIIYLTIE